MADSFIDKEVTVRFEVTGIVAWKGVVVADDENGILIRRPYRRGKRLELIPRDQIRGVYHEIEKGPRRKPPGVKASVEPEDEDYDDGDELEDDTGFEDEPDTEWDDDDDEQD